VNVIGSAPTAESWRVVARVEVPGAEIAEPATTGVAIRL
jgi:hypothetical protein